MITNERSDFIGAHVTREVKRKLQARALQSGMSLSEYLYHLCRKHIEVEELEEAKQPKSEAR